MNNKIENGNALSLSQALELIKKRECENFKNENVNLAELARLTKISRAKLRRLKKNGFQEVERLVQFVKGNFLAGRTFMNVTDLNEQALDWCNRQNSAFHKALNLIPNEEHSQKCLYVVTELKKRDEIFVYLCPERRISFDGFVNYEGRRFGVPYSYISKTVRVYRHGRELLIYSDDMKHRLVTHEVTWSRSDSYCKDQFANPDQPEEFPTADVKVLIEQIGQIHSDDYFDQFDFSGGDDE